MSVKLLLDIRKIDDYGIGTYIKNIFGGLISSGRFEYRAVALKDTKWDLLKPDKTIFVKSKNYAVGEHFEIPRKIKKEKDFIYFSPHYVFPYFIKNRLFVTVHDIIHFKFSRLFPKYKVEIAKIFIKSLKKRAEIIFTVSNKTKSDLINYFNFKEEKIIVIYNGIDEIFFKSGRKDIKAEEPYILYIGNTTPHKNLSTLLKAFSIFSKRVNGIKLYLIGIRDMNKIKEFSKNLDIEDRLIIEPYIPFERMIPIIDNSLFFVFPSLYEGFGLPPLEVMARGKAVISSTGGSLPEILGDSALFFEPNSEEELSDKIYLLYNNPELRRDFEKRGKEHSLKFKWENFLGEYIKILDKFN